MASNTGTSLRKTLIYSQVLAFAQIKIVEQKSIFNAHGAYCSQWHSFDWVLDLVFCRGSRERRDGEGGRWRGWRWGGGWRVVFLLFISKKGEETIGMQTSLVESDPFNLMPLFKDGGKTLLEKKWMSGKWRRWLGSILFQRRSWRRKQASPLSFFFFFFFEKGVKPEMSNFLHFPDLHLIFK